MNRILVVISTVAAGASAVAADPLYRPAAPLVVAADTRCDGIAAYTVRGDGALLVCDGKKPQVKVVSADDRLLATWPLPFAATAIGVDGDGAIVAGNGRVARLDAAGKVVAEARAPHETGGYGGLTSVAVDGTDVFLAGSEKMGYSVYRLSSTLDRPVRIVQGLRGCCGQMDIAAAGGRLYVAENGRFSVHVFDRNGKKIATWGKGDRKAADGFGGCCNPMNLCLDADGNVCTAESEGLVKRFSPDGKFLGVLGAAAQPSGCKRVTVRFSPDGGRVYMLDTGKNHVAMLVR